MKVKDIIYDPIRELIFSIGEDRLIHVSGYGVEKANISHIKCSNMNPKAMALNS